jgi:hypothetical protein
MEIPNLALNMMLISKCIGDKVVSSSMIMGIDPCMQLCILTGRTHPTHGYNQHRWSDSDKMYMHTYIDTYLVTSSCHCSPPSSNTTKPSKKINMPMAFINPCRRSNRIPTNKRICNNKSDQQLTTIDPINQSTTPDKQPDQATETKQNP